MSFKQLLQKIESSTVFQNFKREYPSSELVAGFFILDFMSNDNKQTLDYKVSEEKIVTFSLKNEEIIMQEDKLIEDSGRPKLTKIINRDIKVEVDELKSLAGIKALDNGISAKIHKIIAVLQMHSGQVIWNLTCMLEGLIILNILVDALSGGVIKFERKSMMDLVKKR